MTVTNFINFTIIINFASWQRIACSRNFNLAIERTLKINLQPAKKALKPVAIDYVRYEDLVRYVRPTLNKLL